jgi:hypothetical protein
VGPSFDVAEFTETPTERSETAVVIRAIAGENTDPWHLSALLSRDGHGNGEEANGDQEGSAYAS